MKKSIGILSIQKQKLTLFFPDGSKSSRTVTEDVLRLGEIVNKEHFTYLVKSLIKDKATAQLLVFLSNDITFAKEVSLEADTVEKSEFFDMVPYERVMSKVYKLKNSQLLIATNNDLCETLLEILQEIEVEILGIVPEEVIEKVFPNFSLNGKEVFKRVQQYKYKTYSITYIEDSEKRLTFTLPDLQNRRFLFLTCTFLALFLILSIMLVGQFTSKKPINNKNRPITKVEKTIPTATPSGQLEQTITDSPMPKQ